jgi:hypothetical protein
MSFRVLLVCSKPPFPFVDGGTRAMAELAAGLAAHGHAVHILAMATRKHPDLRGTTPAGVVQETILIDSHVAQVALQNISSSLPLSVARCSSQAFANRLAQLLAGQGMDIVQFEGLHVAPYQRLALTTRTRVVYRAHNIEAALWRQKAASAHWPLSVWLTSQAGRVARLEADSCRSAHAVAAISPAVARACAAMTTAPVIELPVSFCVPVTPPPITDPTRLFHLGAMDWGPTADGLSWFLAEAWPRVLAQQPGAQLHLAGRGIAAFAAGRNIPNVSWDGEVDDADAYVRAGGVLVAPIRTGSGLRVKLPEAMAQGRAIVTTSIGAEALGGIHGQHILVADDPAGLAAHVVSCLTTPDLVHQLGAAAHQLAAARFGRDVVTQDLERLYASISAHVATADPR